MLPRCHRPSTCDDFVVVCDEAPGVLQDGGMCHKIIGEYFTKKYKEIILQLQKPWTLSN